MIDGSEGGVLASDIIDRFLELQEICGCDEETAKARVIMECGEALRTAARDTREQAKG